MKAWCTVDERYPDYEFLFKEPKSQSFELSVDLTPEQARFIKRYQRMREKFEELCHDLFEGNDR